jgi:hypothetical protein
MYQRSTNALPTAYQRLSTHSPIPPGCVGTHPPVGRRVYATHRTQQRKTTDDTDLTHATDDTIRGTGNGEGGKTLPVMRNSFRNSQPGWFRAERRQCGDGRTYTRWRLGVFFVPEAVIHSPRNERQLRALCDLYRRAHIRVRRQNMPFKDGPEPTFAKDRDAALRPGEVAVRALRSILTRTMTAVRRILPVAVFAPMAAFSDCGKGEIASNDSTASNPRSAICECS